jgi:hypothetical protein
MKNKLAVFVIVLLSAATSFGQAELEKYVGQYQVTGAPIMITVTATDGKLMVEVTGQGKASIELISGEGLLGQGDAHYGDVSERRDGEGDGDDDPSVAGLGCSGSEDQLFLSGSE